MYGEIDNRLNACSHCQASVFYLKDCGFEQVTCDCGVASPLFTEGKTEELIAWWNNSQVKLCAK